MPEHVFTVAARGHAVDAQTNTLSLFSVLEQIGSSEGPFAFPELTVATLWKRQEQEEGVGFVQRTRLVDPEGKEVFCATTSFRFGNARQRNLVTAMMTPFQKVGCYRIEVSLRKDDEESWPRPQSTYPIEVSLAAEAGNKELFAEQAK